jgi:hypothetical protein
VNKLKREDVITAHSWQCPICNSELTSSNPSVLPIDTECKSCNMYFDSYHGFGDSYGRVSDFTYSWSEKWDEQGYLKAILAARKLIKTNNI